MHDHADCQCLACHLEAAMEEWADYMASAGDPSAKTIRCRAQAVTAVLVGILEEIPDEHRLDASAALLRGAFERIEEHTMPQANARSPELLQ